MVSGIRGPGMHNHICLFKSIGMANAIFFLLYSADIKGLGLKGEYEMIDHNLIYSPFEGDCII